MTNTLIATIFYDDSIKLGITDYKIDKAILLEDESPGDTQKTTIKEVTKYFEKLVDFQVEKIAKYDIEKVVEKCLKIIDKIPKEEKIIIDITQGKRTQTIGLLFAAYKRFNRIEKIYYGMDIADKKYKALELPKFKFDITEKQRIVLEGIRDNKIMNKIIVKGKVSRATAYSSVIELEEAALITKREKENKYSLTDAGKIMLMR